MKKKSYLTFTDQFCGAGGSSQGVRELALERNGGIEISLALNHWELAIETHNTNFPDTLHDCTDISASDPRRYPSTDFLITSPECTNHSLASGRKKIKAQTDLFKTWKLDPEQERSRATMWDVVRFAEYHDYNGIIVENVVDARKWIMFDAWLKAMHVLGYDHKSVYLNSMHFEPCPQSRDRMYIVFWKKGNPKPNLDFTPKAYCKCCDSETLAYQSWKRSDRKFGKYKQQYVYRCSGCHEEVEPYYYAAFNCIDWSIPGTRIGDRSKPLADKTMERIRYGLERYGKEPLVISTRYTSGVGSRVKRSTQDPIQTQPGHVSQALFNPFLVNNTDYTKGANDMKNAMPTQTTQERMGFAVPYIVEMNRTGKAREVHQFISTVLANGNHHMLINPAIVENYGQSKAKSSNDPLGTVTSNINHGILSTEAVNAFLGYYYGKHQASSPAEALKTVTAVEGTSLVTAEPKIEDCTYRMLKPHEIQSAMSFADDYIILGNSKQKVKQLGNAVTPPVMKWLSERLIDSLS
jgi:DNA (cytosine-5)-methyltransferase 1